METRINYTAVGAFVIALTLAFVGLGLWIGTDLTTRDYQRYSVYFEESVSGLSRNATVTYRGVEVGRVAELRLAPANPELVRVVLEIEVDTPVRADTAAMLRMQGLTGIAQVELSGGSRRAPPPPQPEGEPYPVIPSGPSLLSRMEQAMTSGMETLDELAGQVSRLLAPENVDALSATFANLETITATLADNRENLERSLAHVERLLAGGADASVELGPLLREARTSLAAVNRMADSLAEAGDQFGLLAEEGRAGVAQFSGRSLPQINRAVEEIQVLADNLSRLAEELSEQPEMLIFGRPRGPRGPGE